MCPVKALLSYLAVRGNSDGPLFKYSDGSYLTQQRLVETVQDAIKKYCGHSFRIGAATTAAKQGMEDSVIKTLGRWRSMAYLEYICIPRDQLVSYSRMLCPG